MKSDILSFLCLLLSLVLCYSSAHSVDGNDDNAAAIESAKTVCAYNPPLKVLQRRQSQDDPGNGNGEVGVDLPNVGLTLGNISTKLGNINLTVTNVTISLGNVDIEDIEIGNITVIVSVPLPGASPIQAFSASSSATSIASSTATATSTVSPAITARQTGGFFERIKRQDETTTTAPTGSLPSVPLPTVTIGGGDVNAGAGNIDTEIGNITIFVGNVNVSVGDVSIRNVSIGNIFVLVQIGQPDLTGALTNITENILN